jgi:glycosyltransferase involved in cell wall biosynthesis
MKVLIIQGGIDFNSVTGEDVAINNDISYLKKNGVQVIYEKIKIPSSGLKSIIRKFGGLFWSFSNYKKVKASIQSFKPDIIHFHSITPYLSFSVLYAAKRLGIPVVQTLHNARWLCVEGGFYRNDTYCEDCVGSYGWLGVKRGCGHGQMISLIIFLNNFILRKFGFLYNHICKFIAVSGYVKNQHTKSGFEDKKIIIRNNGFIGSELGEIDSSWLHRDGIAFAGRVSIAKGSRVLEYLIKNLRHDCKIKIIGDGPELQALKKICTTKNIKNVKFFGRLSNEHTIEVIKKSILCVVPSQCGDSYPSVALESLSVGTPVVASNLGGLTEIIKSSSGGLLSDYDNKISFLNNIQKLLRERTKAKQLGDNGMKYINENVDSNKQSKELLRIYDNVIKDFRLT